MAETEQSRRGPATWVALGVAGRRRRGRPRDVAGGRPRIDRRRPDRGPHYPDLDARRRPDSRAARDRQPVRREGRPSSPASIRASTKWPWTAPPRSSPTPKPTHWPPAPACRSRRSRPPATFGPPRRRRRGRGRHCRGRRPGGGSPRAAAVAEARARERKATASRASRDVERLKPLVEKEEIAQQQFDAAVGRPPMPPAPRSRQRSPRSWRRARWWRSPNSARCRRASLLDPRRGGAAPREDRAGAAAGDAGSRGGGRGARQASDRVLAQAQLNLDRT